MLDKKSISGFAQPGPQSPSTNEDPNCNNKNNLNEDDSSKSVLHDLCVLNPLNLKNYSCDIEHFLN